MSTTVSLPDGTSLEFPDGTDPAVIQRAVAEARMHTARGAATPDFSDVSGTATSTAATSNIPTQSAALDPLYALDRSGRAGAMLKGRVPQGYSSPDVRITTPDEEWDAALSGKAPVTMLGRPLPQKRDYPNVVGAESVSEDDESYQAFVRDNPRVGSQVSLIENRLGPLPSFLRASIASDLAYGAPIGKVIEKLKSIRSGELGDSTHVSADSFRNQPDFSDVTGGVSSTADDLLRKKRAQMAQARQIAAAQGLVGPAPDEGVGGRLLAVGDRIVSGAAEGFASIPELAAKLLPDDSPSAMLPSQDTEREVPGNPYPTLGKPGGFFDLAADRESIRRQAEAARERLLASRGDPAIVAAADTLAEAGGMAIPLGEGGRAAKAAEDAQGAVRLGLRQAAPAARVAGDVTPEEAAYLARRAEALRSTPGATEAPLRPGAIADAMQPERSILQVGEHPDAASVDVALGLRARPRDAADAAALARQSLDAAPSIPAAPHGEPALDELLAAREAPPAVAVAPRAKPPSLAEIFGDRQGSPGIAGNLPSAQESELQVARGIAESVGPRVSAIDNVEAPSPPAAEPSTLPSPILRNLLTHEELPLDTPRTGTKNAVTQSERIARGLPEVEDLARKSTGDTWHEARQVFEQDPEAPRLLAQRIIEKPRVLTPVENDLLLHDRMKMTLDHRETLAAESAALDAGDGEAAAMAKMRRTSIESAMDLNDTALKRAGGEWGAAGAARQKLIAEDYSPLYLRQRLTVAAREAGVPPPPGAAEQLDKISTQLAEAQQQLAGHESRVSEQEAQRNLAVARSETVRAQRAGVRQATRQQLDQEYEQLGALLDKKARARQSTTFMSGGLDPETVGIITKMARNRVQAGVNSLPDLVQGIHETIAPHIPGLEPSEVRDAISGYGAVRQQATRSEAEAALARIRQQGKLVSKIEALQEGEALPAGAARAKPDQVTLALREKLRQTQKDLGLAKSRPEADRLAAIEKRLQQRIADAERGIGNTRAAKVKDTPQIQALRQQLEQTLEEHGLAPEGGGRQTTDAQRLAALKTRLAKREVELADAIASGSIPKKVRRPLALDADALALQGRVNNLKRQADLIIRRQELAGRGPLEKGLDWTAGWGRFLKLTGTNTLVKISAAAAERALIFKPIEEVIGAGLSKLPVVRDVAARAPIEGGGSLNAIAKSYAGFFGKQARQESVAYLRGGVGPLESALGKPHLEGSVPAWMEYPGKVHAALKSPAKVAAYQYAMEKQAKHFLSLGQAERLTDPVGIAEMQARAWEYAERDIFMGDNAAVRGFRKAFELESERDPANVERALRQARAFAEQGNMYDAVQGFRNAKPRGDSAAARVGKTFANVMVPIVKVPTNYALEATDYLAGLPKGIGRLAYAVHKGLDRLPAEQAELIMRQLKKGTLGAAMISLGAAGVVEGGGYYQAGEHRAESDLKPGEVRVAGITIPHLFLHHPVVEALQVGASLRRAKSVPAGAWTATKGLAEQVPFVETPLQMSRDLWGRTPMKAVGEFTRGMTIPPDAQRLARVLDQKEERTPGEMFAEQLGLGGLGFGEHQVPEIQAVKRKSHGGFWEQLMQQEELGIPGLRDNVR